MLKLWEVDAYAFDGEWDHQAKWKHVVDRSPFSDLVDLVGLTIAL